jgi:hypothetical protein
VLLVALLVVFLCRALLLRVLVLLVPPLQPQLL